METANPKEVPEEIYSEQEEEENEYEDQEQNSFFNDEEFFEKM